MENIEKLKQQLSTLENKNRKEIHLLVTIIMLFIIGIFCVTFFFNFTFLQFTIPLVILIYLFSYYFRDLPKNVDYARRLKDDIHYREILEGEIFEAELTLINGNIVKGTFYNTISRFDDIIEVNTNIKYIRENVISIKKIS